MKSKFTPSDRTRSSFTYGIAVTVWIFVASPSAYSEEGFSYFKEPEIDFWKAPNPTNTSDKPKVRGQVGSLSKEKVGSEPFTWSKYLDPKQDDFFREGEYLPPAPFMEIARNPTSDNIEKWFQYLQAKNEVLQRLQVKLAEYAEKHPSSNDLPPGISPQLKQEVAQAIPANPKTAQSVTLSQDARRFRLRLYFDSKCPHCERMIGTLKSLARQGYWIELKQIDADMRARKKIPFPVDSATPNELKQYQIQSVPVLLIGDVVGHGFFKLQGYQAEQDVAKAINQYLRQSRGGSS